MSKQIRVSDNHYDLLEDLSDKLGMSRAELLSQAIGLVKMIAEEKPKAVKFIDVDGNEREILIALLVGMR